MLIPLLPPNQQRAWATDKHVSPVTCGRLESSTELLLLQGRGDDDDDLAVQSAAYL
jgi:hypothetical protein